jgi:hypothetical protein
VYSARPASDRRLPVLLANALAVAVVRAVLARRLAGTRKVGRHVDRVQVSRKDELIRRSEETLGTIQSGLNGAFDRARCGALALTFSPHPSPHEFITIQSYEGGRWFPPFRFSGGASRMRSYRAGKPVASTARPMQSCHEQPECAQNVPASVP